MRRSATPRGPYPPSSSCSPLWDLATRSSTGSSGSPRLRSTWPSRSGSTGISFPTRPGSRWESLAGFLLAIVIGVPLAGVIAYSRLLELTIYPILLVQRRPEDRDRPDPVLWMGFGTGPKILVAFSSASSRS